MENKTGKYFKYAIGEIILVVIGILIALSINNWNEERKDEQVKNVYYQQLLTDLNDESENLLSRIELLDSSILSYESYEEIFGNPGLSLENIITGLSKVDYFIQYPSFNTNTIETLLSTGDIKLIPAEIRNSLVKLNRNQNGTIALANGNDQNYLNSLHRSMEAGWNPILTRTQINNPELFKLFYENIDEFDVILKLEAAFSLKNFTELERVKSFRIMLEDIEDIKRMIYEEFKK